MQRPFFSTVIWVFSVPVVVLVAPALGSKLADISISVFTRDASLVEDAHPFAGVVSNVGILTWGMSPPICFLASWILRRLPSSRRVSKFMLCAGVFTFALMIDDLMLVHEGIARKLLGMPEEVIFVTYAMFAGVGVAVFRDVIARGEVWLLAVALACFALSIGVDITPFTHDGQLGQWRMLAEDGFKLMGISAWSGYLVRFASQEMREVLAPSAFAEPNAA